jgi:hypothetical protein
MTNNANTENTDSNQLEPLITNSKHFRTNVVKNEVGMDLDRFLEIINENNSLKDQVRQLETENAVNPWKKLVFVANTIDSFRPWSKALLTIYMFLLYDTTTWFMALEEPTVAQAGLISTIVGVGAAWFGLYVNSGPKDSD